MAVPFDSKVDVFCVVSVDHFAVTEALKFSGAATEVTSVSVDAE